MYLSVAIFFSYLFSRGHAVNTILADKKVIEISLSVEDFSTFFEKFSSNSSFRKERTVVPFNYKMINEEGKEIVKKTERFPIELDKKKWKEKVIFEFSKKDKDTTILSISIEDTGYLVQVIFVKKANKWYALKAENLSD